MEDFLKERGIPEEDIERMRTDKVDDHVVLLMSDEELGRYISSYGDRIALFAFLRGKTSETSTASDRKRTLADRILEEFKKGTRESSRSRKALGNKNAKKRNRRVEIGWINYDLQSLQYKQVRTKKGGGVRHSSFDGEMKMNEILNEAKKLFFDVETGYSKQGNIDSFDIQLVDSSYEDFPHECTISEVYEKTKVKLLRCYMKTTCKRMHLSTGLEENITDGYSSSEEFVPTSTPTIFFRKTKALVPSSLQTDMNSEESQGDTASCSSIIQSQVQIATQNDESTQLPPIQSQVQIATHSDESMQLPPIQSQVQFATHSDESTQLTPIQSQVQIATHSDESTQSSSFVAIDLSEFDLDNGPPELTLDGILRWWQKGSLVDVDEVPQMLVRRCDILRSTLRLVQRDSFNFCRPFQISFSGEDGDDFGGPKREFFRLLLTEICDTIFCGPDKAKFFLHDLEKLTKKTYEMSGRLVAFSLLHGGPGIPVLHSKAYQLIIEGEIAMDSNMPTIEECIFDIERKEKLVSLQEATNQEEYKKVLDSLDEWCLEQSLSLLNFHELTEKDRLIDILKKNEIFYRVQSEIVQFKNGLNMVGGFLEAVMLAPSAFKPLFVQSSRRLRFQDIKSLYKIRWSEQGTNDRTDEEKAIYCFEAFLVDCEGGLTEITLEEVLSFWTGASTVPPLGFHKDLEVEFVSSKQLPAAHTCALILSIWRGFQDPDDFEEAMKKSVKWAGGFHLV